jgi:gamma-glutamyltranspeptidase/glutathione hydrolase
VTPGARSARSATAMVATGFPDATEAGLDALRRGGNAIDAAVAAAWALAVCEPSGSGLGGQTMMTVHRADGSTRVIAGCCRAPRAASRETITRAQQRRGLRACAAPTTPGTLEAAVRRHGRLNPAETMAPAIRLATEGYAPTALQRRQLRWCADALGADEGGRTFLAAGAAVFRQPRLARTLERIAEHGAADFHAGAIAAEIVADMRARGGLLAAEDLADAQEPDDHEPLSFPFAGHRVLTMGPPGGGIELALALRELEDGPFGDDWQVRCAEAVRLAFWLREQRAWGPEEWLRHTGGALPESGPVPVALTGPAAEEGGETTHVCAADGDGNVVSLTQSIQSLYGAKAAHPGLGFLYNNYLRTCPRRRRHGHRLGPRAYARSNAAPTIVLGGDGTPRLAIGAAGSRRIISSLAQVMSATMLGGTDLVDAVAQPRVHPRLDGTAWVERDALSASLRAQLAWRDLTVVTKAARSFAMGAVQAIAREDDGTLVGVADGRRDGEPRGL